MSNLIVPIGGEPATRYADQWWKWQEAAPAGGTVNPLKFWSCLQSIYGRMLKLSSNGRKSCENDNNRPQPAFNPLKCTSVEVVISRIYRNWQVQSKIHGGRHRGRKGWETGPSRQSKFEVQTSRPIQLRSVPVQLRSDSYSLRLYITFS